MFWGSHLPPGPWEDGLPGAVGPAGPQDPGKHHQRRLPPRAPALRAASDSPTLLGTRQARGAGQPRQEPEGSTRNVWAAVAAGARPVLLLALKHSKMTFASHFQKTATVRIEGSQPQGGDPAPQPAPAETTGVGEGGAHCISLGLRK